MPGDAKLFPSFPFRIEFEVNGICNLDCTYCYAKPFNMLNPPLDGIEHLFRKTKEQADPFEIVMLGGEPFARKDIIDLFEIGMNVFQSRRIGVSTNGTLLNQLEAGKVSRLKEVVNNGFSIQVTLDSVDPSINDSVRGKTKETLSGLDTLERASIPFIVGIVLTKANQHDIINTVAALSKKYRRLMHFNLEALQPTLELGERYFDMHMSGTEMRTIYYKANEVVKELGRGDVTVSGVVDNCENIKSDAEPLIDTYGIKTCLAGLARAGVYPDGGVTPCTTLRDAAIGNLYFENWEEIWSRAKDRFAHLDIVGNQCQVNINAKHHSAPLEIDGLSALKRNSQAKRQVSRVRN